MRPKTRLPHHERIFAKVLEDAGNDGAVLVCLDGVKTNISYTKVIFPLRPFASAEQFFVIGLGDPAWQCAVRNLFAS